MIRYQDKNFYINDQPTLLMTGEVHYFRLDPDQWLDRLQRLKKAGMNSVATYIPWILHEMHEGQFDFDGKVNPKLNLRLFLKMCADLDLYLIVRPGPFVMAEMKKDGLPFWIYDNYKHLVPQTWENQVLAVPTIDFTHPDFLNLARKWYQKVNEVMLPFKSHIIMYQIDNEIGMLSWVSNTPILTDFQCEKLKEYILDCSNHKNHYSFINEMNFKDYFRNPNEQFANYFLDDLTNYMRIMFKDYAKTLRQYAINDGFNDVLYAINIHGTGGGRGLTYPIGISQLYELLKDEDFITGSDVYFNEFTIASALDMYNCNELTDCLNGQRPLTTLEFNAGDSNFGDDWSCRVSSSNTDFKTRLHLLQNNRLLNFYLFCGGINDRFDFNCHDGNDRYATTGHRHGFASLIDPLGKDSHVLKRLTKTLKMYQNLNQFYSTAKIDYDDLAFGFIPNYYKTEYFALNSQTNQEIKNHIQRFRDGVSWDGLGRGLRMLSFAYQAIDLQQNLPKQKNLFVNLGKYCEKHIQEQLVKYVKNGNTLIICGLIPTHDLQNNECTIIKDFLEVSDLNFQQSHYPYQLSVVANESIDKYESHVGYAQTCNVKNATKLFHVYDNKQTCGFLKKFSRGQVLALPFELKSQAHVIKNILETINLKPNISYQDQAYNPGIFIQSSSIKNNGQFIYVMNYDEEEKEFDFEICKKKYPVTITLGNKEALNLPYNLKFENFTVLYANSEILDYCDNSITFKKINTDLKFAIISNKELSSYNKKEDYTYHFVIKETTDKGDITVELS